MTGIKNITSSMIADLSLGGVFLATGGGGDPYIPRLLTERLLERHGPVTLLDAQDLADDAHIITLGAVGAPTVSLELLSREDEAVEALRAYEKETGKQVDAIVAFEIGGGNSLLPLMAGAASGLPVIDGDGMGRALPEAQMMTFPIMGVKPTPAVSVDYCGNTEVLSAPDTLAYEPLIRDFAMRSGGMVVAAEHPMTGLQLKESVVPGTVSFSIALGNMLRLRRGAAEDLLEPLRALFSGSIYGECRLLATGKVTDKTTKVVGGFDVGEAIIEPFGANSTPLTITIRNEYLLATQGDQIRASVPDLIVIVEADTGEPINAERLRYGQRVAVFAIGAPAAYRTERALKFVGPKAFGFAHDYLPLEQLD